MSFPPTACLSPSPPAPYSPIYVPTPPPLLPPPFFPLFPPFILSLTPSPPLQVPRRPRFSFQSPPSPPLFTYFVLSLHSALPPRPSLHLLSLPLPVPSCFRNTPAYPRSLPPLITTPDSVLIAACFPSLLVALSPAPFSPSPLSLSVTLPFLLHAPYVPPPTCVSLSRLCPGLQCSLFRLIFPFWFPASVSLSITR